MSSLEYFAEPYEVKKSCCSGFCHITLDGEILLRDQYGFEETKQLVALLNGAYNLGRSYERIRQETREK